MNQPSKAYWIPAHVATCLTPMGAVLLDLKRNRYFGIGERETRALLTLARNCPMDANAASKPMAPERALRVAEQLARQGLLTDSAPVESFARSSILDLSSPRASAEHADSVVPVSIAHFAMVLRACFWTKHRLRSHSLYDIVAELSQRKESSAGFSTGRAIELAIIFRRLRPHLFAAKDQCLFHALALVRFLSYYEIFPTLVIGVRMRPWAAHSWVQHADLILDGNPEQVYEYTPILAV